MTHDTDRDGGRNQAVIERLGELRRLIDDLATREGKVRVGRDSPDPAAAELPRGGLTPIEVSLAEFEEAKELILGIGAGVQRLAIRIGAPVDESSRRLTGERGFLGAVTVRLHRRDFLRGVVETRVTLPLTPPLPERVFLYLVSIPGLKEKLTRENHGQWGYHYHYMDANERRSDTLLTFDQNSSASVPSLLWERHAEGDKFKAKADKWGTGKRQSIYSVCQPDTRRWPLSAFKKPSVRASPVWP
jgi:hypothetical protein